MKYFSFSVRVVVEGDPLNLEECTTAVAKGLACGRTAGEAADRLARHCDALFAETYTASRRDAAERQMMRFRRGEGRKPQLRQWGVICVVGRPSCGVEVADDKGEYLVKAPLDCNSDPSPTADMMAVA